MLERIEQVLDEKVRPALRTHDGDIKVCLLYTSDAADDS